MKKITALLVGITAVGIVAVASPASATIRPNPTVTPTHTTSFYTCYGPDPKNTGEQIHWTMTIPCPHATATATPTETEPATTEPATTEPADTTPTATEPATTTSVTPSTSAAPAAQAIDDEQLPVTGSNLVVILLVGLGMLLVGILGIIVSRRRNHVTFTS
jgi:LPXTG-motif cell wall-anchored protein